MSVLIRMEMPKTCEECTLESYCSLWVDARRLSDDGKKAKIRHPDCPLIEIPPHGDLIDRGALAEQLGITDMDCFKCAWGNHGFCGRGGDFNDACEAIEDALTIIQAEEGKT